MILDLLDLLQVLYNACPIWNVCYLTTLLFIPLVICICVRMCALFAAARPRTIHTDAGTDCYKAPETLLGGRRYANC